MPAVTLLLTLPTNRMEAYPRARFTTQMGTVLAWLSVLKFAFNQVAEMQL